MHIARCLCSSHITASCPLAGVVGNVLPSCVQGLAEPSSRSLRVGEINGSFLGVRSSLCQSLCFSFWLTLGFTIGKGIVTVVFVHPTLSFTSLCGVVPVGSVKKRSFIFPLRLSKRLGSCVFFRSMVFYCGVLLCMLVAEREPTLGYCNAHSLGTPKWACWVKYGQKNRKTTLSPLVGRVFWSANGSISFGWLVMWMLDIGRARQPGPGRGVSPLVSCRWSLSMSVGC